jgi:hypothetical protein
VGFVYRSPDGLQYLGEQVRDKAIKVTMGQQASYAQAQERANNEASRAATGQEPQVPGYKAPTSGRPDEDGNLRGYVEQAYAGVPLLFAQFGMPNPDDCQPMVDAFYTSASTLNPSLEVTLRDGKLDTSYLAEAAGGTAPVEGSINVMTTHMKQWEGEAADGFEYYIKRLEQSARLQRELSLSLAVTLEAQLEIRRRTLTDIYEIGQKTLTALDSIDGWCPGSRTSQVQAVLTIGGAVAAVAFAGATGVGAIGVGVEGLQSAAAILGAQPALTPSKETIGGMTVPPILSGMAGAITKLATTASQQEQDLVNCLAKVSGSVSENWGMLLLAAPAKLTSLRNADRETLESGAGFYIR